MFPRNYVSTSSYIQIAFRFYFSYSFLHCDCCWNRFYQISRHFQLTHSLLNSFLNLRNVIYLAEAISYLSNMWQVELCYLLSNKKLSLPELTKDITKVHQWSKAVNFHLVKFLEVTLFSLNTKLVKLFFIGRYCYFWSSPLNLEGITFSVYSQWYKVFLFCVSNLFTFLYIIRQYLQLELLLYID